MEEDTVWDSVLHMCAPAIEDASHGSRTSKSNQACAHIYRTPVKQTCRHTFLSIHPAYIVVHTYNLSMQEVKAGGSGFQGQTRIHETQIQSAAEQLVLITQELLCCLFMGQEGCSLLPFLSLAVLFVFFQGHNAFIKSHCPCLRDGSWKPSPFQLHCPHLSSPFVCTLSTRFQFILNSLYD